MYKVGINGFGRIGKCILRGYFESSNKFSDLFKISSINSNHVTAEDVAYYLKYDSTHGPFKHDVDVENNAIIIDNYHTITISSEKEIEQIDWHSNNIDIVMECSGSMNKRSKLAQYINKGIKKVLISAPCDDSDITIIMGVNDAALHKAHNLISLGSCTTNCFIPILKPISDSIRIESGFMTTIHAYTNDQKLLDGNHEDKRRSRAANLSIIPTKTGVNKLIKVLLPTLEDKIETNALRVPVNNVSLLEFKFFAASDTTVDEIHKILEKSAEENPTIIKLNNEELVSIDFCHSTHSAIIDTTQTSVINKRGCRIYAWYDNEWAFANRMLELCQKMAIDRDI